MKPMTIAEKILSNHAHKEAYAGDIVFCDIDRMMCHDANGPMAVEAFRKLGGTKLTDPKKVVFIMDHGCPAPYERLANLHKMLYDFAVEQGSDYYGVGEGVCHQLMIEKDYVKCGDLVIGTDSHTCTYGAIGAFSTGVGATDMGVALKTGQNWFKVPETIKINLNGKLNKGCTAKDIILTVIGKITAPGANYLSVEFYGDYVDNACLADKMTIANMVVEMGGKCGYLCSKDLEIKTDENAVYKAVYDFDLAEVVPCVAKPHMVDNYAPVKDVEGTKINEAFLGSCTNGRIEDLRVAAKMLKGNKVAEGVKFIVNPASKDVFLKAVREGVAETIIEAGGAFFTPGCGVCVGTHGGVLADGDVAISTANRNFKGRMGNNKAFIYLASVETVTASAIKGYICDPREFLED